MDRDKALWDYLKEEFGITTMEELDMAIAKQKRLDISLFCCDSSGKEVDTFQAQEENEWAI